MSVTFEVHEEGRQGKDFPDTKETRRELSLATRDSLAIIQRNHKTRQIRRGGGDPVKKKWTTRHGEARRSFHIDWKKGDLFGKYGSDLHRIRVMEEGGEIRPKTKQFLTVPTKAAPKGARAGDFPDLFFIKSLKGQPLLARSTGKSVEVLFILKRLVRMPARPTLQPAVKATRTQRIKRLDLAFDRLMGVK